jgi:hypothetical protein
MYKLDAAAFVRAMRTLESMRSYVTARMQHDPEGADEPVGDASVRARMIELIASLRRALVVTQAKITDKLAQRFEDAVRIESGDDRITYKEFAKAVEDLGSRLQDELETRCVVVLAEKHASLYLSDAPLFGVAVFDRFSIANDDIAEAGKCLALERGTATVFHLMRVMEAGLKALGAELGIPYAPSWESYIRQLDTLLDGKNYANLTPEQKQKRPFYTEALGDLMAIKSVWRNTTMHIVRSYDTGQAARVYEAVMAFMENLAKELSADPSTVISTGQSS